MQHPPEPRTATTSATTAAADDASQASSSPAFLMLGLATPPGRQQCVPRRDAAVAVSYKEFTVKKIKSHKTGVLSSPNFPENYPNDVAKTHIIQVQEGSSLSLEFTAFDVELDGTSCIDSVTIIDGSGTTLMAETCGGSTYGNLVVGGQSEGVQLPASVNSTSNLVNLIFTTSESSTLTGWNLTWSAVSPASISIGEYRSKSLS